MNRITRKLVSLLGIVAVVFAQLAASAYACPLQFIGQDEAIAVAGIPDAKPGGRDADSPALCQQHCEQGQQNVNDTPQPQAVFSIAPALVVTLDMDAAAAAALPSVTPAPSLQRTTSPPLTIRHCCFRI